MNTQPGTSRLQVGTVGLGDIRSSLPEVRSLDGFALEPFYLVIVPLGFEERLPLALERLAKGGLSASRALVVEYVTNKVENESNRDWVLRWFDSIGITEVDYLPLDSSLERRLTDYLRECITTDSVRVLFDITVASNPLIHRVLRVLLQCDLDLTLSYGEAAEYHPTESDYQSALKEQRTISSLATSDGTQELDVTISAFGEQDDSLPDQIVIIPGFDTDRVRKVITQVDPSLLMRDRESIIWILGEPHSPQDSWRVNLLRDLHGLTNTPESGRIFVSSTFDYISIWNILDDVYEDHATTSRITISPMGSKLQAVGIVLFCLTKPDVKLIHATPRRYKPARYTKGLKAVWLLEFGQVAALRQLISSVGEYTISYGSEDILAGTKRIDWKS